MTIIQKFTNKKCWLGFSEKRMLVHCWDLVATIDNRVEVPQKTESKTTI